MPNQSASGVITDINRENNTYKTDRHYVLVIVIIVMIKRKTELIIVL